MGAWGTSLYANDAACDLRGDYLEKLKDGKSNQDATQELLTQYQESLTDPEEAPLVWFALADTQWDYGRLLPEVKEAALHSLQSTDERERWRESGEQQRIAWEKTLRKLEEKLSSPQPPEKKIYKHRCYQCKWALGDTFAYQLTSDYSKALGYEGKYIVFRKDAAGSVWETVFDIASLAGSIVEVSVNPGDPWAWAGLVGDALDLVPFVTGLGEATRAVKATTRLVNKADDVVDAAKAVYRAADATSSIRKSTGVYEVLYESGKNYVGKGGFSRAIAICGHQRPLVRW